MKRGIGMQYLSILCAKGHSQIQDESESVTGAPKAIGAALSADDGSPKAIEEEDWLGFLRRMYASSVVTGQSLTRGLPDIQ